MKTEIMSKATRLLNKTGLQLKKHSPEIFMVAGIAGTVASTVMACKATPKAAKLLEAAREEIETIHQVAVNNDEYTEKDLQQALTISYTQTGVKLVKLYAPAIALGTVSIASIVWGHNILKKRNIALAAAYAAVDTGFKNYRKNVVERFGEGVDKELRYNIKAEEIKTETVDENGKKKKQKEIVNVMHDEPSIYSRYFDESCPDYRKDAEWNMMFLRKQQEWANEKLRSQGYLFLNEVYEQLGMLKSKAGQVVGWVYDSKNDVGDNYIDFGIYDINRPKSRDFVNGYERSILLDFNVDGDILNSGYNFLEN